MLSHPLILPDINVRLLSRNIKTIQFSQIRRLLRPSVLILEMIVVLLLTFPRLFNFISTVPQEMNPFIPCFFKPGRQESVECSSHPGDCAVRFKRTSFRRSLTPVPRHCFAHTGDKSSLVIRGDEVERIVSPATED